jgi:hypothetical protein
MKKQFVYLALSVISILNFTSCNTATPEKYFNTAVLNTNLLAGFAGNGMLRQIESPSVKLDEKTGETVPMNSSEIIKDRIKSVDETLSNVKDLKQTDDTKEMLQASVSLYEFVLPVYKNEYIKLAESIDKKESAEKIDSEANAIHEKYFSRYDELYKKLISIGKVYAENNNIKVNWNEN